MLKAEIQSYFARLSPLPLTLSEKVRLTNSQLVPALAYRLITHSLSPNQLEKLQALIWAGIASRSVTRLVSPKDGFAARPKGGLGMKFLPHSVHVATVNYGLRALCGLAPKSVGRLYVQSLLSSNQRASDPVQNSFMDSIHALGISFHSIGPWRPTAIRDLTPGTQLTVRFKSGQATGRVTEATSKWANVLFHDGVYSVDTHTSYTMHMPCHAVMDYSRPSHFQLVPEFLRPQETIPEPPAPPHTAHALGISQHGHLFALQAQHYLGKKSLDEWGCHDAAQALTRPPTPGLQRVWLYSDGSSGESGHAAAVTAFLPDGTTRVLCLSSPHPSSLGSEFWGAVAAIRWIHREFSLYEVCLLIDNEQVVSTLQRCQVYGPSPFQDDTWTVAVHSALLLITNPLHIMWIKGHGNFIGNEICDHFSKWAAHSLIFTPDPPPPPPHSVQGRYTTCLSSTSLRCSNYATCCRSIPIATWRSAPASACTIKLPGFRPCFSNWRPGATMCTGTSGAICSTTTTVRGADSTILSTLYHAWPSAKRWTSTSRHTSPPGDPFSAPLSCTGGSLDPQRLTAGTS